MQYDYYSICDCGWNNGSPTLASAKSVAKKHLDDYCKRTSATVLVNRNQKGGDIDDTFKDVRVLSTKHERAINQAHADVLGKFFSKI